jgi:hypothetical protein
MSRLLLVVAREEPTRYAYFKHTYSSDTVDVIIDRRAADRRCGERPVSLDRRQTDRRRRDLSTDLQTFGWALVRH